MAYSVTKLNDYSDASLQDAAQECVQACEQEAAAVSDDAGLKLFRDRWLGRKNGILTQVNDLWLKAAPKDSKRAAGAAVNQLKTQIETLVEATRPQTSRAAASTESIDIFLPGVHRAIGAEHPVIRTQNEIVNVFQKLGYSVAEGPIVETDYYNFEALNFPPNHPARDTQDTLFIAGQQAKPRRERLLLPLILRRCRFAPWRRWPRRCAS